MIYRINGSLTQLITASLLFYILSLKCLSPNEKWRKSYYCYFSFYFSAIFIGLLLELLFYDSYLMSIRKLNPYSSQSSSMLNYTYYQPSWIRIQLTFGIQISLALSSSSSKIYQFSFLCPFHDLFVLDVFKELFRTREADLLLQEIREWSCRRKPGGRSALILIGELRLQQFITVDYHIYINYIKYPYVTHYYLFIITCMEFFGIDDNKKIGMFMLAISMLLYALGILFLFRRSLILVSNVLFFVGLYFFIGVTGIIKFFTKKGKIQGSAVYFIGLSIIVVGFTFVGTVVQLIGLFIIFRSFLPDFYDYLCRLPYVGSYLKSYRVQNALDKLAGNSNNRI